MGSPPNIPPGGGPMDPSRDEFAQMKAQAGYRRARRKARERAGEIKELNITAMMDMMTIILVFLLKSYSASSTNVNMSDELKIPQSTTQVIPQDNINVTISLRQVAVNDKAVIAVENGLIPPSFKGGDPSSFFIGAVHETLKKEVDKQKYIAKYNPAQPFTGRVNIIADKRIPYRTLLEVLYTAGQAELGEYKFMVMKSD